MRILRSVAAIAVGLGFMAATVTVGTLVASALIGDGAMPLAAYLSVNLAVCGIGAILGGWLVARIASFAPYGHAAVMAAIVAVLSITTAPRRAGDGLRGMVPLRAWSRRGPGRPPWREAARGGSVRRRSRGSVKYALSPETRRHPQV